MEIGTAIRDIRKSQGIKQKELADKISISYVALSAIEKNKSFPKKDTLNKIAEALNKPLSVILIHAITEEDVPKEKIEVFKALIEPLKSLL